MPDVSHSSQPDSDDDRRSGVGDDLVDIVDEIRSLMALRNQAAERERDQDRPQWA